MGSVNAMTVNNNIDADWVPASVIEDTVRAAGRHAGRVNRWFIRQDAQADGR